MPCTTHPNTIVWLIVMKKDFWVMLLSLFLSNLWIVNDLLLSRMTKRKEEEEGKGFLRGDNAPSRLGIGRPAVQLCAFLVSNLPILPGEWVSTVSTVKEMRPWVHLSLNFFFIYWSYHQFPRTMWWLTLSLFCSMYRECEKKHDSS